MEKTITFHVDGKDKTLIDAVARKKRLSTSAYCRINILDSLWKDAEQGNLKLLDLEKYELKQTGGDNE